MFNHLHYVPILKSKRAEFRALQQLTTDVKLKLTPLIDVIPVPWDHATDRPRKSLKQHLDSIITYVAQSWPIDYPFFIDLTFVNDFVNGKHSLMYCLDILRVQGRTVIPVTGIDFDDNYYAALSESLPSSNSGLCIRISTVDLDDFDELSMSLENLLSKLHLSPLHCDIILDFQTLPIPEVSDPAAYISNVINIFPRLQEWRTFTIAASSFPKILEMSANTMDFIARDEYQIWSTIIQAEQGERLPSYSDYTIQHPDMTDVDYRKIKISVNLRYATPTNWLVYKGREKNRYGHNQFNQICRDIINRPEYNGQNYSAGDHYIYCCAHNTDGPGNTETWRRVGFSITT